MYDRQDRGDASAYDFYLRSMDASMRQKVALTAAHLLCEGRVADMGMGSGSGSFALARLYPELEVIGVDVNPEMVERAREAYRLENLSFLEGDIAAPCFAAGSLEAILDSSVLHHVTSFNGYDRGAAARCLEVQAEELAPGGVLVVRDFIDLGAQAVWLDVRSDDGDPESDEPEACSSARLLERFAREFRALRPPAERGFALRRLDGAGLPEGFARYELAATHAVEFVLRKDYRESWDAEVLEEYTFATQAELEALFAKLGLRVLASTPLRNPWIVSHRFAGKIRLWTAAGEPLGTPPTNHVIVGQKVPDEEGVRIVEARRVDPIGFLERSSWRHVGSDRVRDLARRPGLTLDVIPWFRRGEAAYVLARRSYPRPILGCHCHPIDGAAAVTYVTEPLTAVQGDKPAAQTAEELLAEFPALGADAIRAFEHGTTYYPSPGGIQEEVRSLFVEIDSTNVAAPLRARSGFTSSGLLRAIEAQQLLRAAQVGALPDARLELNTYELLLRLGLDAGDWIGEAIELVAGSDPAEATSIEALVRRPRRRAFRRVGLEQSPGFLEVRAVEFAEQNAAGREVARQVRELVVPAARSLDTVALAVLRRAGDAVYLGVDDEDFPAAQCFEGHSQLLVAPAWRLPAAAATLEAAQSFVTDRLAAEHGLVCRRMFQLGGRYHPSAGLTPEAVHPFAVDVMEDESGGAERPLAWVPLADTVSRRAELCDGHLRIVLLRAAHALGLLRAG
jgi:SAM-dependent methyltransferase